MSFECLLEFYIIWNLSYCLQSLSPGFHTHLGISVQTGMLWSWWLCLLFAPVVRRVWRFCCQNSAVISWLWALRVVESTSWSCPLSHCWTNHCSKMKSCRGNGAKNFFFPSIQTKARTKKSNITWIIRNMCELEQFPVSAKQVHVYVLVPACYPAHWASLVGWTHSTACVIKMSNWGHVRLGELYTEGNELAKNSIVSFLLCPCGPG